MQEINVELLWDIREARDLVGAGPAREELPGLGPEGFFHGEEAQTLDEGAFDLAVVDGGVDGAADVHFDVSAEDGVGAGQDVKLDFRDCYTLVCVSAVLIV